MLNMNRVTLLGHAGRDPEIRTLNNGTKAASFALATTERWKNRDGGTAETGAVRERTEWHRVVAYGAAADATEKLLRKGAAALIEGRLATREYRDRDGNARTITEIVVAGPQGVINVLSAPRGEQTPGGEQTPRGERDPGGEQDPGGAIAPAEDETPEGAATGDWL